LGFSQVFRYTPGKVDWLANGWPVEGEVLKAPHAGDLAREDVFTCRLTDRVGAVRERLQAAGYEGGVVVNEEQIVLGLLRTEALTTANPETSVEQVMESGPRTYRLDSPLQKPAEYMRKHNLNNILVTTTAGKLVGLLYRQEVEQTIAGPQGSAGAKT
jgi:predicted transcriptional regulator